METQQIGQPILFIKFQQNEGFKITDESKKFLMQLQGKKLGIISIVGKYRTGKSYLINRMILEQKQQKGFTVGPTINACTKGIWIWSKTLKSQNSTQDDMELLIMDTEGFGGVKEGINHDTRIFLFSLLLSSLFIYNSVGNIDENALQSLSLVLNLAKEIQKNQQKNMSQDRQQNEDIIAENFPDFLWVVRDFSLKLVDSYNNAITENTYLENSLAYIKGNSDTVEKKNQTRRLIKHFFRKRECITMVRPVEQEKDLQNLEHLQDYQLRPDFLKQIKKFKKIITQKTKSKNINNIVIDGQKLIQLAEAYIIAVNNGKIPDIDTAWNYMKNCENQKIYNNIIQDLENQQIDFLVEDEDNILKKIYIEAEKILMGDKEENIQHIKQFKEDAKNLIKRKKLQFQNEFTKIVLEEMKNKCQKYMDTIFDLEILDLENIENEVDNIYNTVFQQYQRQLQCEEVKQKIEKEFEMKKNKILSIVFKKLKQQKLQEERTKELRILQQEKIHKEQQIQMELQIKGLNNELENEQVKKKQILNQQEILREDINKYKFQIQQLENQINIEKSNNQQVNIEQINILQNQISELKAQLCQSKNDYALLNSEFSKEKAILQQKNQYLEQDLQQLKQNIERLQSIYNQQKIELDNLRENQINRQQMLQNKNIVQVEQSQLNEMTKRIENFKDLEDNYKKVIQKQEIEIQNLKNKNMNLEKSIQKTNKDQNSQLNQAIANLQSIVKNQQEKSDIKKQQKQNNLKKLEKYSLIIQCSKCNKFVSSALFLSHLDQCLDEEEKENSDLNFKKHQNIQNNALEISISQTLIKENTSKNLNNNQKIQYTEYIINVSDGVKNWYISRKFKDFSLLLSDLQQQHPYIDLPKSCKEIQSFLNDIWGLLGGKSMSIEVRRQKLQKVLQDLQSISLIRQSYIFKKFIGEIRQKTDIQNSNLITEDVQKYYLQRLATD